MHCHLALQGASNRHDLEPLQDMLLYLLHVQQGFCHQHLGPACLTFGARRNLLCLADRCNSSRRHGLLLPDRAHPRLGDMEHMSCLRCLHVRGQLLQALPDAQSLVVAG